MNEAADLTAALAAVTAVAPRFLTASDTEFLADLELVERIGRVIDSLRVTGAAEAEHRSRKTLGEDSLAFRFGARDGIELVQLVTAVGHREAKSRVGIGAALASKLGLGGETLPGRFPDLADAVAEGSVGVEAARMIVNLWKDVHFRADRDALESAMGVLVQSAKTTDHVGLEQVVWHYRGALDPDGVEGKDVKRQRKRALRVGNTLADGTTSVSMVMTPEDLADLLELLQSRRRGKKLIRTEAGSDETDETLGPEWREDPDDGVDGEPRSRVQQDYDTATEAWRLATRAEAAGFTGAPVTHETIITITADEVEDRRGQGWAPGIMAGLPMPVIEQQACTGGTRLLVTGATGEPLFLSLSQRLFSPAQKVALTVAAGGTCQYPGCDVPAPYLEAHHVRWYARDGGATDIGNGIMLCSYHHHLIHAKHAPVEIREHDGEHWIVPKGWVGAPDPTHRRQTKGHLARGRPRRMPNPWT